MGTKVLFWLLFVIFAVAFAWGGTLPEEKANQRKKAVKTWVFIVGGYGMILTMFCLGQFVYWQ